MDKLSGDLPSLGLPKRALRFIKVLLILLSVAFLSTKIRFSELITLFHGVNALLVVFMFALWPFSVLISVKRWSIILERFKINLGLGLLFSLYWAGIFFNNFFPSSFGGDVYKLWFLSHKLGFAKKNVLASVVLERGMGFLAMVGVALFTGLLLVFVEPQLLIKKALVIIWLIVFLGLLVAIALVVSGGKVLSFFESMSVLFGRVIQDLRMLLGDLNFNVFLRALGLSVVYVFLSAVSYKIAFSAFGSHVPLRYLLFVVPVLDLSGLIPVSLNSVGIREGIGVYLLGLFNVNAESVLAVILLNRIAMILLSVLGGLQYLIVGNKSHRE